MKPLSPSELTELLCSQASVRKLPRSSVFDQRLTSLLLSKESDEFKYNGALCAHKPSEKSGSGLGACVVLEALHLRWCRELGTLIDMTANSVVLGTTLKEFLQERDSTVNPDKILKHINDFFDLSETLEALQARIHGLVVQQPIEGLAEPVVRFKCNICGKWFGSIPKHRNRTKDDPKHFGKIDYDIKPQWCIPLFKPGGKQSLMVQNSQFVPLDPKYKLRTEDSEPPPSDTIDSASILTPPSSFPKSLTIPAYVHRLGWDRYLSRIESDPTIFLSFHDLASRPRKKLKTSSSPHFKLESFLRRLPNAVIDYLSHAIMRIREAHQGTLSLVTEGYDCFSCSSNTANRIFSTNGTFSLLTDMSLGTYQVPATQALTFALRYGLLDRQQLEEFKLMQLGPIWKGEQSELVSGFLETLLTPDEDLSEEAIWKFIHVFLVQAFTSPLNLDEPIDSILEQGILFAAFSKYHGWTRASSIINGHLKFWQFIKRCVSIHAGFLGSLVTPYSPPPGFQDLANTLLATSRDDDAQVRDTDNGEESDDDDNKEDGAQEAVEDEFDFSFLESSATDSVGKNSKSSISE